MLQFFRRFFQSKVGIAVTLGFLALIAFAFASSDVANTGTFGGVAGGDRVAVVGDTRIDSSDLAQRTSNVLARIRQQNPTLSMEAFLAENGLRDTLDDLINRTAIAEYAQQMGFRAGSRLVDSEIVGMANMRALDGSFDTEAFRTALRQQGISEDMFRRDLAMGLLARQMVGPAELVPQMPLKMAQRYAQLRLETRSGLIAALSAEAFAPATDPTDAQLQTFYQANSTDYIRPERRVIRYAVFGEEAFGAAATPTEAQIAERFERDSALYAASETRSFTQLIAPTQAAAQAIVDEVRAGTSLEASARSKGLSTTSVPSISRADLATQTSNAVADAAFAAGNRAITAPAQGDLGWYVLRVDSIERRAARTLAQVRGEIAEQLAAELRQIALGDGTARIEQELSEGRSLAEVAQELGVEITTTRPMTAAGQIYGTMESAPAALAPVLSTAFEMDRGNPQLAEAVPGESFIIFDVADITPSAVAPLAEIRPRVIADWKRSEGMRLAGGAVQRILTRVGSGTPLAAALQAERVSIPAPQSLRFSRQELERSGQVGRPVALFFSMAEGTTKALEAPEAGAWFIVQLNDISAPDVETENPIVRETALQLLPFQPRELADQFIAAIRALVKVEINEPAVEAVAAQLTGRGNK
ncbi:peptidylprolyl isomerase [Altererythrobacter lauratis]|uniref:Parvulin-like PPIase n=1 Tax=Alteraurantiacibacter lauratis TaxID=2054627 RepID=A0ABV7ED76_9SPHN